MATLVDNWEGSANTYSSLDSPNDWHAQSFTAGETYEITRVGLHAFRDAGSTPGTLTVLIQGVSGNDPDGSTLASGTTNATDFPVGNGLGDSDWVYVDIDVPYELIADTQYYLIWHCSGVAGGDEVHNTERTLAGDDYAGGARNFSSNAGSSWNGPLTGDYYFRTYKTGVVPFDISGSIEGVSAFSGLLDETEYIDFAGSIDGAGAFSAAIHVLTTFSLASSIDGVSAFSADITMNQTHVDLASAASNNTPYLIAINNNQVYYQQVT